MWPTFESPVSILGWQLIDLYADYKLLGSLESWPLPSGAEQFQMWELMDQLALENQVIEGMMSQLHLVHSYNNMLIKW